MHSTNEPRLCGVRLYRNKGSVKLSGFYRGFLGNREGLAVWVVDGGKVATDLFEEFIMGGNDQRYRFNPLNEVWIDDRLGCDELEYTLQHELLEVRLMREKRYTYNRAHNCSLDLELEMRVKNLHRSRKAFAKLTEMQHSRQLTGLQNVDMKDLTSLYRVYAGGYQGAKIWIVDGGLVRHYLDPNFWAGGNGLMVKYIPKDQIWLDASTSCLESHYALRRQKLEFRTISNGSSQHRAYELGLFDEMNERERQTALREKHEAGLPPVQYGARARGVKR